MNFLNFVTTNHSKAPRLVQGFRGLLFVLTLAAAGLPFSASAKESNATDLGSNLSYIRVQSLADSASALQSALSVKNACVLDLRYTRATNDSVAALRTALAARPPETSLFILISPATPAVVFKAVSLASPAPLTLGITDPNATPSITVRATPEEDRQAYDAFESGIPLKELTSGKIEKERYDEATLVHEFKNGNIDPSPVLSVDPTKSKTLANDGKSTEGDTAPVPPLRDKVLQRALNLHQALLALRR